ncbi:MAG: CopG family transcriptional regulator [Candidatus Heimdallarchaeota archaeon]|nr:CopG family transcriptional regulator [Candidatus Heimdallarchaeota archaeon]
MNDIKKEIIIPEELYNKLTEKVSEEDDFETVEEFVIYLLKQSLSTDMENAKDEKEEEEIKERLKKLGYL